MKSYESEIPKYCRHTWNRFRQAQNNKHPVVSGVYLRIDGGWVKS